MDFASCVLAGVVWESGWARVIYIFRNDRFPIFLITAYPKNEKDNLTKHERNELAKRTNEIFAKYGGRP